MALRDIYLEKEVKEEFGDAVDVRLLRPGTEFRWYWSEDVIDTDGGERTEELLRVNYITDERADHGLQGCMTYEAQTCIHIWVDFWHEGRKDWKEEDGYFKLETIIAYGKKHYTIVSNTPETPEKEVIYTRGVTGLGI